MSVPFQEKILWDAFFFFFFKSSANMDMRKRALKWNQEASHGCVGSTSAPSKRGRQSSNLHSGAAVSVLLSTKQDASFPCKCIEIRPLMTVAIIGGEIHLNMDEPFAGKTNLCLNGEVQKYKILSFPCLNMGSSEVSPWADSSTSLFGK